MPDIAARRQRIEVTDLGLALLALATGSADVTAFLTLGNVFTSAMTGNAALLIIALSQARMLAAFHSLVALFGFICGAALATTICDPAGTNMSPLPALRTLFILEVACLVGFAVSCNCAGHPANGLVVYGLILLSAVAMGIQGVAARHINAPGINTIVFTSTLVSIVTSVTRHFVSRSESPTAQFATGRQIAIFLAYGTGAALAGFLVLRHFQLFPWIPVAAVVLALGCYRVAHKQERSVP